MPLYRGDLEKSTHVIAPIRPRRAPEWSTRSGLALLSIRPRAAAMVGIGALAASGPRGGLEQELGDLHGVEGGTFEELVPDHPES